MALSKVEQLKAERNPLRIIDDIYEEARGGKKIDEEHIGLLKWYGMYPHVKDDEKHFFMKRIKFNDNGLNLEQLKVMADITNKFCKGYSDFTTRQNIQLHYVQIKDLPEMFDLLESVNLTSYMASGDGPRPMVGCPISGIAEDDLYDVTPIFWEIDNYFKEHEDEYCNFPRKYKIGLSGCTKHCMGHEIQDVGFTAFKSEDGEVLFDLTIGGGLSKTRRVASRAKRYLRADQIKEVAIKCADIFRDMGNRENRNKARIRDMVANMGIEAYVEELEKRLGYSLDHGEKEPEITPYQKREHFGIHKASTKGESYIGVATRRGRVWGEDLEKIYQLLKKYDAKGIRLTTTQNFVVYGVKDEVAQSLADELTNIGFPYKPTIFEAKIQSCTGIEFCKFAVTETKDFADVMVDSLNTKFPELDENLSIAVSGCPNGCSHPHIADIGLIGTKVKDDEGNRVEGYQFWFGGHLEGEHKSRFSEKTKIKVPSNKVDEKIEEIINDYLSKKADFNNFSSYIQAQV
ncbi:MAG: Ferredoxin--nitrite reductase (Fragment) [uncultured Campylobacterales bacterium]|uniref:Ferredoxin--nitrite reductase n=1 Tax=uncultured Campylobacterales bacterium TaxID=352960 RepID=A0A6S6SFA1_9BACT